LSGKENRLKENTLRGTARKSDRISRVCIQKGGVKTNSAYTADRTKHERSRVLQPKEGKKENFERRGGLGGNLKEFQGK